jgi:hypothetical protein
MTDLCKVLTKKELSKLKKVDNVNRPSPPYHANDCKDVKMIGTDGNEYKIVKDGKTAREYFSQFKTYTDKYDPKPVISKLKILANELKKNNIFFLPDIRWDSVHHFIDYAWDDAQEYVSKKTGVRTLDVMDQYSFMLYTNHRMFFATVLDGDLTIQHNILDKDLDLVYNTFKKHFGTSFKWNKSGRKTMIIKLPKK